MTKALRMVMLLALVALGFWKGDLWGAAVVSLMLIAAIWELRL